MDDLGHQEVGHERVATDRAISVAVDLVSNLRARGFVMSGKSLLLASSTKAGQKVQAALKAADVEVQLVQAARDLGVDGHARRRSTAVMHENASLNPQNVARLLVVSPGVRRH